MESAVENDTYKYVELKGDVRFDNVVFGYTSEKTILNGISLVCKAGAEDRFCRLNGCRKDNDCQSYQPVL